MLCCVVPCVLRIVYCLSCSVYHVISTTCCVMWCVHGACLYSVSCSVYCVLCVMVCVLCCCVLWIDMGYCILLCVLRCVCCVSRVVYHIMSTMHCV